MGERLIEETGALVKYDTPILVAKQAEKKERETAKEASKPGMRAKTEQELKGEVEQILNNILPPKEWEEDGHLWRQYVSTIPATRLDVVNLQEQLDMGLQLCQARESGIDPNRRDLFTQCYDELIRQETLNCAERGLLLIRVKDEMKVTIDAYRALYLSSIAFGMRKALDCENQQVELLTEYEHLMQEKIELEQAYIDLKQKSEQTERRNIELRTAEEKQHAEEISFIKKTNQQLKAQLEGIIAPKKG